MNIRALILLPVLGYLVWTKLIDHGLPPEPDAPKVEVKRHPPGQVDVSREPYIFAWAARRGERPAPELAMRIEPTDLYAWWGTHVSKDARQVRDTGNGPEPLKLDLLVPSADAFSEASPDGLCPDSETSFHGCRIAHARIIVWRDDTGWDTANWLLGSRSMRSSAGFNRTVGFEFWTRKDPAGRDRFVGWECGDQVFRVPSNYLDRPPKVASPLPPPSQCYERPRGDKRAEKHRGLIECRAGEVCEVSFLYHRRLVTVDAQDLPLDNEPGLRGMVVIAAWETLDRIHANALRGVANDELDEARVQQKVCRMLGDEIARGRKNFHYRMGMSCRRAKDIASRLGAEEMLADLRAIRLPFELFDGN